tara:strand:- start:206 stop:802 length:597 start_codon:yes stop_codon:yes gene_type:complete
MSADQQTVDIYNKHISDYEELMSKELKDTNLDIFIKMISIEGKVLDLGCGTGSASLELMKRGFSTFPVDASIEMVKVAESLLKIKVRKISFDEIDEHNFYHAIWANFSLLHITKSQFSDILKILFFALKEEGILFFSLKQGAGESRDKLGRFYSYYEKNEVEKYLEKANFQTRKYTEGVNLGLAGDKENWMGFFCEKI